jgi:hypothetical protein
MAGFRRLVDSIYPEGFTDLQRVTQWLRKLYDVLGQVEEWHEIGDTNEPAFTNSWTNDTASYPTTAFYKDPMGRVHLKGQVLGGNSGSAAFTLPAEYRPSALLIFAAYNVSGNTVARVYVTSAGLVTPLFTGIAPQRVTLNGISFRAEQ